MLIVPNLLLFSTTICLAASLSLEMYHSHHQRPPWSTTHTKHTLLWANVVKHINIFFVRLFLVLLDNSHNSVVTRNDDATLL